MQEFLHTQFNVQSSVSLNTYALQECFLNYAWSTQADCGLLAGLMKLCREDRSWATTSLNDFSK